MIRVLSLGAGVQSSCVFLMSCKGVLPKFDAAVFADPRWEPKEVYENVDFLKTEGERAGIPIHVVHASSIGLREKALRAQVRGHKVDGVRWASMPLFVDIKGNEREGRIKRQCTTEEKIEPIERFVKRELLGLRPRQRAPRKPVVEQFYGISKDEAHRMRMSPEPWRTNEYPLCGWPVEYLPQPITRQGCLRWLAENYPGRTFPRSACLGCPFHSDAEWAEIKKNPEYWKDVVDFDRSIRDSGGMRGKVYVHRSLVPLDQINFDPNDKQMNLFGHECQGICGV